MASTWLAYNELAWTEDLLADLAEIEAEIEGYVDLIKRHASAPPATLLHLGSGAGIHDTVFKRHFAVTGVDLSVGMQDRARQRHPDIEYLEGDMRTVRLGRVFDAVVIPDSIDYMASAPDLRRALDTAAVHLRPGGVLLVVGKTREVFSNNNFAYSGEQGDVQVTVLENNHVDRDRPGTYEATLVYLIRQRGELTVHTERHVLGLFPHETWRREFAAAGFSLQEFGLDGTYDRYLLGDGEYPLQIFNGRKPG